MDYHALTKKCDGMCDSCECPPARSELVTCGGGPPGDPNGEQTAARILELEQNEARLETFIMQQDMRIGDLQRAVQRLKDLNNELFVSRCQAHMRTEQLEDFLRRMLEAATPQIGHAWKAEIRLALVETNPDSKTPAEFECLGEPSLCANPRGCGCAPDSKTHNA